MRLNWVIFVCFFGLRIGSCRVSSVLFLFLMYLRGESWFMSMFILFVRVSVMSMHFINDLSGVVCVIDCLCY